MVRIAKNVLGTLAMSIGFGQALAFSPLSERSAVSLEKFFESVGAQDFVFADRGRLRNFFSTESCLFQGQSVLLVQHYCYPKRSYPARSFTFVGRDFGIFEFYEETLSGESFREVRLLVFPEDLEMYLEEEAFKLDVKGLNRLLEALALADLPACWASNQGDGKGGGRQSCYRADPRAFEAWLKEAAELVGHADAWQETLLQFLDLLR